MNIKSFVPFKGAVRKLPKQKTKMIVKNGVVCTCGMVEHYYTLLPAWHLPVCIINSPELYKKTKRKKKRKGRRS